MNQIELDELRNFYKNEQGEKLKTAEQFWTEEIHKMFDVFKEKIINKEFTVGHLDTKYKKNELENFIKIKIEYDVPNGYIYPKIDNEGVLRYIKDERPRNFFDRIVDLIKKEFGFSKVGIEYSYKRGDIFSNFSVFGEHIPWNALERNFILNFRV